MKDPTIPMAESRKKIMFYESPENQTRLKIRCDYDGITQSQFFRMMISGYIRNDENIYQFIKNFKQENNLQGIAKINKIESTRKKAKELEAKFALNDDELEDIFDVIEMETGIWNRV